MNFLEINLDLFEANWILELDCTLATRLVSQLGALLLALFFGPNPLIFLPKRCHVSLISICHFLVLDLHLKALKPILSFQPIRLLESIGPWTLDPPLKALGPIESFWPINLLEFIGLWTLDPHLKSPKVGSVIRHVIKLIVKVTIAIAHATTHVTW